jgi:uncharacterized protein (TIGR02757 family)
MRQDLRESLERLRERAIQDGRVEQDPIRTVLNYPRPEDREVVGLIAALLAYGRVELLLAHTLAVLQPLAEHPARRLKKSIPRLPRLVYRFHRTEDLQALLRGIRTLLLRHGSLRDAFAHRWQGSHDLRRSLGEFVAELSRAAGDAGPGLRYLLPDPFLGGSCKRWHLYLRWMVRKAPGDPDPGDWSGALPASALVVPLDTHLIRVSRRLGLTTRRTANWKMAEEVTAALRRIDPEDPVRYDFPLCHLGITGGCPPRLKAVNCRRCLLRRVCPTARIWARPGAVATP